MLIVNEVKYIFNPLVDADPQFDSWDAGSLLLIHNVVTNPVHAIL